MLAWIAVYGLEVDRMLAYDARYSAESWLATHARADEVVEVYQQPTYLPRFPSFLRVDSVPFDERTIEGVEKRRPDWIVLSSAGLSGVSVAYRKDWQGEEYDTEDWMPSQIAPGGAVMNYKRRGNVELLEARAGSRGAAGSVHLTVQPIEAVVADRFDVIGVNHRNCVLDLHPPRLETGARAGGGREVDHGDETLIVGFASLVRPRPVAVTPLAGRKAPAANTLVERAACREGDERMDRGRQRRARGAVANCDLHVPDTLHRLSLGGARATGRQPNQREAHTQHHRPTTHVTRRRNCQRHGTLSLVIGYRRMDWTETPQSCRVTAHPDHGGGLERVCR